MSNVLLKVKNNKEAKLSLCCLQKTNLQCQYADTLNVGEMEKGIL